MMEDEDTPETEDYEEDSESDVEDDGEISVKKDYVGSNTVPCLATASTSHFNTPAQEHPALDQPVPVEAVPVKSNNNLRATTNNDEGFIDESDCDCDTRNFCQDSENRVPFQYCFSCAPFHPSNGRGPTLVGPNQQQVTNPCPLIPQEKEQEDKLIYDMDLKSTQNQPVSSAKRKRQISSEETEDAINSILPKKRRESSDNLDDFGYQSPEKVFHPAFRDATNGMEVDQITSLVSIFSFGQQFVANANESSQSSQKGKKTSSSSKDEDDSDSDSDTSSDSGHSSDDQGTNNDDKSETSSSSSKSLDCSSSSRSDPDSSEATMSCLAQ